MQIYKKIETEIGTFWGRDCIFLHKITFENGTNNLILDGEIDGNLCNPERLGGDVLYRLRFEGILALSMIELDSWDCECESSFDEILDSEWIRALGGKVSEKHRHFLLQTYDDVFEVVCETYTLAFSELPRNDFEEYR